MTNHRHHPQKNANDGKHAVGVVTVVLNNAPMRLMGELRGCFPSGSQLDL